jgi:16S rRNA (cytidine1402-2'-O)-methyltransferase
LGRGHSASAGRETRTERKSPHGSGKSSTGEARGRALAPGLYVVATPIGNASDIALRALNVLSQCDAIVAEDTRVTARLLAIHGISRPLLTYNDHNAPDVRPKLLERLAAGASLALVSDAGTPLISDPGHKLVREARAAGIAVYPIPGASAVLAALVASGLPTDRFLFAGFLPARQGERRTALQALAAIPATLVLFESPQRLAESLADMAELLGQREAVVARELTKLHEEIRSGTLHHLAESYRGDPPKGEVALVIAPPGPQAAPESAKVAALLHQALPFMPVKAAAGLIADALGLPRRAVYEQALAIKADRS